MRVDIMDRRLEIEQWIFEKQPKAMMCRELKCKQDTLNAWFEKMGIEYAGKQGWSKGQPARNRVGALEYIAKTHPISHRARLKLIEDGIKEAKCERCQCIIWMGQPIPLALHHIDGNRWNWALENLEIICPNCHYLTDGFSGRGIGKHN